MSKRHEHQHHDHGGHHHDHGREQHHGHAHGDGLGQLAPAALWQPTVHRLGRRRFLADLGRRTFAVAILGAGIAACADDDDAASPSPTATPAPDQTAAPTAAPTTAAPAEPDPTVAPADEAAVELQWSQVNLGNVSAYVLVRGREAAVVDTGNPGSRDQIGEVLATLGTGWGEVRHVLLTHSHPDHIGSLSDVLAEAPTATAYAGEADIGNIRSPNPLQAVDDGDEVFGLEILATPGHTPGSISMLDSDIGLLIAGDALNGDEAGSSITGPNPRFSDDLETAAGSVLKLADRTYETAVFGHGNPVLTGADTLVTELSKTF